ncbi:hypothetical protein MRS76_16865 [Rhizobiaceae bacterium n13]|uniref:Uncharacterized protein n=1 Tax=Ferirhizobium litorale TaxID=2927786 RepID=A0AAE3QHU5_9HYPH|nr:hypothetical protein [Fererhizobium litorale]MDI7863630.1 hypothetical protein [Fererhizobium litorale]MDI7923449.1 hypothetical protein [Fererhizobium litorale]
MDGKRMNAPSQYFKGCYRVATPVTLSPSFHDIVSKNVSPEMQALARLEKKDRAAAVSEYIFQSIKRVTVYDAVPTDVCYYGGTKNNVREFEFLEAVLNEFYLKYSQRYFLQQFGKSGILLKDVPAQLVKRLTMEAAQFVETQDVLSGAHIRQLLEYTRTYLSVTMSYHRREHLLPKIAVVANDHSPWQVAFAAAMETNTVPVVYVQHAEVSPAFPALDFTASVLRNAASHATYKAIAPPRGHVFVVSRNLGEVRYADVVRDPGPMATIGIFPTSHFETTALSRVVEQLRQNPSVEEVFVKLHPNGAPLTSEEIGGAQLVESVPDTPFVALVGNSSVVLELLARGVPSFLHFELDEITPDYYGFVRDGIAPRVLPADLSAQFWQTDFYGSSWLQRIARFDPAVLDDGKESRRELAAFLGDLIRNPQGKSFSSRKYVQAMKQFGETILAALPYSKRTKEAWLSAAAPAAKKAAPLPNGAED